MSIGPGFPIYRFMVVICREGASDVTPFEDGSDAREYFDQWSMQWTESFLCQVMRGPGPAELYPDAERARILAQSLRDGSARQADVAELLSLLLDEGGILVTTAVDGLPGQDSRGVDCRDS